MPASPDPSCSTHSASRRARWVEHEGSGEAGMALGWAGDDLPVDELRARGEVAGEELVEGESFGGDGHRASVTLGYDRYHRWRELPRTADATTPPYSRVATT